MRSLSLLARLRAVVYLGLAAIGLQAALPLFLALGSKLNQGSKVVLSRTLLTDWQHWVDSGQSIPMPAATLT